MFKDWLKIQCAGISLSNFAARRPHKTLLNDVLQGRRENLGTAIWGGAQPLKFGKPKIIQNLVQFWKLNILITYISRYGSRYRQLETDFVTCDPCCFWQKN